MPNNKFCYFTGCFETAIPGGDYCILHDNFSNATASTPTKAPLDPIIKMTVRNEVGQNQNTFINYNCTRRSSTIPDIWRCGYCGNACFNNASSLHDKCSNCNATIIEIIRESLTNKCTHIISVTRGTCIDLARWPKNAPAYCDYHWIPCATSGCDNLGVEPVPMQVISYLCRSCYAKGTSQQTQWYWVGNQSNAQRGSAGKYTSQYAPQNQGSNMRPSSTASANTRIWWDTNILAYRIAVPYDKSFTDLLKTQIPSSDRSWESDTKTWVITEKFLDPVHELIKAVWGKAKLITREDTEKAQAQAGVGTGTSTNGHSSNSTAAAIIQQPIDVVIMQFFKNLPYEAARAAFKRAAGMYHPDLPGGDASKMTILNSTWTRIEKEFFKI